jgi:hypothetical protein
MFCFIYAVTWHLKACIIIITEVSVTEIWLVNKSFSGIDYAHSSKLIGVSGILYWAEPKIIIV